MSDSAFIHIQWKKTAFLRSFFPSSNIAAPSVNKLCMRKVTKEICERHKIRHFHVAMTKGIIYTNLAILLVPAGWAFLCE